jgi:transposase
MASVAETVDAVIGGDTHAEFHQLEIATPTGAVIDTITIDNDDAGFTGAIDWISGHAPGPRLIVGLEGTRSYGVGLARALRTAGFTVVEVEQPSRKSRRGKGKSDPIDAHHAVRETLAMDAEKLPTPRADGDREALRILLGSYRRLTDLKRDCGNALKALLVTGDDTDRTLGRGSWTLTRIDTVARRRGRADDTREQAIRSAEARRLSIAWRDAHRELKALRAQIVELVQTLAPGMLAQRGVGPISAAQLILTFSHPGRCRHDSAFAMLTGAAPLEATSGKTQNRHRLNYGGDRQANRALHDIAMSRIRYCERTQAYVARRTAEGKTSKEIRRCLKRYIARQQYRFLTTAMTA